MTRFFKRSLWDFHIISFLYCELNINMIYSVQTIKERSWFIMCLCAKLTRGQVCWLFFFFYQIVTNLEAFMKKFPNGENASIKWS